MCLGWEHQANFKQARAPAGQAQSILDQESIMVLCPEMSCFIYFFFFFKNIYLIFVVLKRGQAPKCVTLFHPFVLLGILRLAVWTLIWVNIQRQATSPSVCFVLPAAFALSFMTQWGPLEAQSLCVCGLAYVNIGLLFVRSPHPAST